MAPYLIFFVWSPVYSPPFLCKLKYSNLILGVVGEKFKLTQSIKNFVSFELNVLVYKYI